MKTPALLVVMAGLGVSCDSSSVVSGPVADGVGPDPAIVQKCLGCHSGDVGDAWSNASSHRVLFDCDGCHHIGSDVPHSTTPALPTCDTCHSNVTHQGGKCTGCHDPHGSTNIFLIDPVIVLPDGGGAPIHFTAPEGASADGLVHGGTGLCEACHSTTTHYTAAGTGTPHQTAWCATCHLHSAGFAPPDAGPDAAADAGADAADAAAAD